MPHMSQDLNRPRVVFVYPNPRRRLAEEVQLGVAPDSTLLGQNHLASLGIDARIHDPLLTRRALPQPLSRVTWNVRELTIPWEVGHADALFTPLAQVLPLAARMRRRVRELALPWELGAVDVAFTPLASVFPLAARARRLPVVVVNYGLNLIYERSARTRRQLLRASLGSAASVVCLGETQREMLLEQTGLRPERVRTALLGIDAHFFSPRPAQNGEPYVLAVGKDLARDYATLARALEGLGVRAEIAAYPRNLVGISLPPGARARVVGPLELRDLYANAACVVIPQRGDAYPYGSEGGGLTALLEAMAMGKPIVASDRPIIREYVDDGRSGITVPPEDAAALRAAIDRVLGDPGLAAALGAAARALVERTLTTRHFAERLVPVLLGS
jgi:glycosyltransferase involved in cell wall biosynthesis